VVAAFDVDGTLTTGDCVVPFLRRLAGARGLAAAIVRRPREIAASVAGRDRDRLKEAVVGSVFEGRDVDSVAAAGREFANEVLCSRLRADMIDRLRWHQQCGHRTVLVSASLRPYLEPLAGSLGIDGVVCTDVVADGGRYTDRLLAGNCRGLEKVVRLRAWLGDEGLADAALWAYGDTRSDEPMLAMAAHPIWVSRATVLAVPPGFDELTDHR
jgi:phosphatidylglycerophosphatase C